MKKIFYSSCCIVLFLMSFESAFGQIKGTVERPDDEKATTSKIPGGVKHDWTDALPSENNNKSKGKGNGNGNRESVPSPRPVSDSKGGNGGGRGEGGGSGGKGNSGGGGLSPREKKDDDKFNKIVENSGKPSVGPSSGSRPGSDHESSRSALGHDSHESDSGRYTRESSTHKEHLDKGRFVERKIAEKSKLAKNVEIKSKNEFVELGNVLSGKDVEFSYQTNETILDELKQEKITTALFDYSKFTRELKLIPFKEILYQTQNEFDKSKKILAEKELKNAFPKIQEHNLSNLIKGRNMIRDWKIADKIIEDALFHDLFVNTIGPVSELQRSMETTYVGPLESGVPQLLNDMEAQSQYRLSEYIGTMMGNIVDSYFGATSAPESAKKAVQLLQEASQSVKNRDNILTAASKILEAKLELKMLDRVEASYPEDLIMLAGIGFTLSKKIAKYGVGESIEVLLAHEEKNVIKNEIKTSLSEATKKLLSTEEVEIIEKAITSSTKNGITVLGKVGNYEKLAAELNANHFHIPYEIWKKMSPVEKEIANNKFLDEIIKRGDKIVLSDPVLDINNVVGFFKNELLYMFKKGYKLNSTGTQLIR